MEIQIKSLQETTEVLNVLQMAGCKLGTKLQIAWKKKRANKPKKNLTPHP